MRFLEEKLNETSQTRDFIVRDPYSKDKKKRVITLTKVELEYIFKGMRPRSLDYYAFADVRKILQKELAQYLKGSIVHLSKVSDTIWNEYTKDMKKKAKQRGHTFVKDKDYKKPWEIKKLNKKLKKDVEES